MGRSSEERQEVEKQVQQAVKGCQVCSGEINAIVNSTIATAAGLTSAKAKLVPGGNSLIRRMQIWRRPLDPSDFVPRCQVFVRSGQPVGQGQSTVGLQCEEMRTHGSTLCTLRKSVWRPGWLLMREMIIFILCTAFYSQPSHEGVCFGCSYLHIM